MSASFLQICFLDSALNLAGTETTGTNINSLRCSVNNSLNFSDVRLPGSVGLAVRVRNVVTESHTLVAYAALCHVNCTSQLSGNIYYL